MQNQQSGNLYPETTKQADAGGTATMHNRSGKERRTSTTTRMMAIAVALFLLSFATPASALETGVTDAPTPELQTLGEHGEEHCVVELVQENSNYGLQTPQVIGCFDTLREAQSTGQAVTREALGIEGASFFAGSWGNMATHFTGSWYSGSSITITGTCTGQIWQPGGFWNNNFESHYHYCGSSIRFSDSSWCFGSGYTAWSSTGSYGWMNNRTSCIRYG